jgi:hypothetical protein
MHGKSPEKHLRKLRALLDILTYINDGAISVYG